MPVDIEKCCAGIGNFNRCSQYPVPRFELRVYNISSKIDMSACVFPLIFLCISNLNTILEFLLVSCFHFVTFCFGTANVDVFLIVYQLFISAFFSGAVLEHLTDY